MARCVVMALGGRGMHEGTAAEMPRQWGGARGVERALYIVCGPVAAADRLSKRSLRLGPARYSMTFIRANVGRRAARPRCVVDIGGRGVVR